MTIKKLGRIDSKQEIEAIHLPRGIFDVLSIQYDFEDTTTEIEFSIFSVDKVFKIFVLVSNKVLKENDTEVLSLFIYGEFKLIDNKYQ